MRANKRTTSWDQAADWYDRLLESDEGAGTYQKELILPNLMRLMRVAPGARVLDLGCGQGFFSRALSDAGAHVLGIDASKRLIELARTHANAKQVRPSLRAGRGGTAEFRTGDAASLPFVPSGTTDAVLIVLALQNMERVADVFAECARVLKPGGVLHVVLNHPAFRVPHASSWGWDEAAKAQYRRIDAYLSESKEKIVTHPGSRPADYTWSFHRPLQFYVKALAKAGLAVAALEEWNSHKKSEPGPRAKAEDRARKEIPLFLYMAARTAGRDVVPQEGAAGAATRR
ncbi:MAG TPA: methyltransferase domain-containing protein [Candidatus Paceibacterota bacterium]|nr:methyltransferase domain-containing protein [Candidatus Paceibacterota bacterium]